MEVGTTTHDILGLGETRALDIGEVIASKIWVGETESGYSSSPKG